MEIVLPFLIFTIFGGVIALIIAVSRRQMRRGRENLAALAGKLGMPPPEFPKGFWAGFKSVGLAGNYRGRALRVYSYTTGSGKNQTSWCALGVEVQNASGLTLKIARENLFTRIGQALGMDDVKTEDAAFDQQFYLKSNDPAFIRAAFIPEVRAQISTALLAAGRGTLSVEGRDVKFAEVGSFSSDKICGRFPALIELACLIADVVEARPASGVST